jgi:hypothetical protein
MYLQLPEFSCIWVLSKYQCATWVSGSMLLEAILDADQPYLS